MVIAMTAAAVVLLGACGGDDDAGGKVPTAAGASGGKTSTTKADQPASEDEILKYFACLRKNGVDIQDPKFDANGNVDFSGSQGGGARSVDRDAMDKAQKTCGPFPNMGGGFSNRNSKENQDNMLALAKCMRQNGIDMPDPDFSSSGSGEGGPFANSKIDRNDPKVQAALTKCRDKLNLPAPGQGQGQSSDDKSS